MITVQLLGGAGLRAGGAPLRGPPAQRHRIALLTLVVAAWPQPLARDRAMALLWPERDLPNARRLLNLAVHVLRAALGEGAIASAGDGLLLDPARVRCDLHDLRVAIDRVAIDAGAPERVVALYAGPLLDGFHLAESSEFGHWLDERRHELAHAYVGALLALAERQEAAGDLHGRVGTCRRLVAADPHSGAHARRLMHALAAAGDAAGARRHADAHAHRLRADLDLDPDPEVVAAAESLRKAAGRARALPVAVLPFREVGGTDDGECFADGITEDVIAHLAKIRALKVISRTSAMRFKERPGPLREVGAALGAAALLEGSVRRAGDRVRVVARLVDVEGDRHLWTATYDRQLTDIFAIQTEVALHIAAALEAELTADERTRVKRAPTGDVLAYQLFLQGRQCVVGYNPAAVARAIGYFERAVARDARFALAHAALAMALLELGESGTSDPDVAYRRAAEAAAAALRLDPDLGAAHCAVGHLKTLSELAWDEAEEAFQRALALSPGSADTYDLYGRLCSGLARHDEAIALLLRAQELDPLAHRVDLATALLRAGRLEEAIARAEGAAELDPCDRARATLGWAYFLSGRRDEGLAELERAVAASPESTMWLAQLGQAHGLAGNTAKARAILHALEAHARHAYVAPYHFAYVHTGLGDAERAMDWLERAVAERSAAAYGVKGSFLFAPLHAHPRYRALLRRMRLE